MRLLRGPDAVPAVVACSALTNTGLGDLWTAISELHAGLAISGELATKRRNQLVSWTRAMVRSRLLARLDQADVRDVVAASEAAVLNGDLTADQAATAIVAAVNG